jgi:hypothetical protein
MLPTPKARSAAARGAWEIAMRRPVAVNARLKIIETWPAPKKHGLQNPQRKAFSGAQHSLWKSYCRAQVSIFPIGNTRKTSGVPEVQGFSERLVENEAQIEGRWAKRHRSAAGMKVESFEGPQKNAATEAAAHC